MGQVRLPEQPWSRNLFQSIRPLFLCSSLLVVCLLLLLTSVPSHCFSTPANSDKVTSQATSSITRGIVPSANYLPPRQRFETSSQCASLSQCLLVTRQANHVSIKLHNTPVQPVGRSTVPYSSSTTPFVPKWTDFGRQKRNSLFGRKRSNGHSSLNTKNGSHGLNSSYLQHYLEPVAANPNYWIPDRYHENVVCLLASFSGIVRVRPSNSTFRGGTFSVSPEDSLGRRANCERNSRNMFWKFSQYEERKIFSDNDDEENDYDLGEVKLDSNGTGSSSGRNRPPVTMAVVERSNRLLSAGFHVVGSVIEFHIAYIECLQKADKNLLNNRYQIHGESICANLSVSFDLGSFGDRLAYECNHIWSKTLKDVHYNQNRRHYSGEVQISLKMVRIDKDPIGDAPYAFRRIRRRCAWDSVLSWQSLSITGSLLVIFIVGFFALCVCSNSSCHDETGHSTNWCCPFCCCRRHRRQSQGRGSYSRQENQLRPQCGHHNQNHRFRSQGPPPPPPPSSSTSLLTNTSSHPNHMGYGHRKPTFSASYSYDANGSNPTQQSSSSALSTAIDDSYYYHRHRLQFGLTRAVTFPMDLFTQKCATPSQSQIKAKLLPFCLNVKRCLSSVAIWTGTLPGSVRHDRSHNSTQLSATYHHYRLFGYSSLGCLVTCYLYCYCYFCCVILHLTPLANRYRVSEWNRLAQPVPIIPL